MSTGEHIRDNGSAVSLRDLCAGAMAGDERAFEHLHRRVGGGIRRLLLKRSGGREELVDDLTQKTWSSVWQAFKAGKYDPERSAITTFVYAVANNAWLSHLRSFAREQGYTGGPATLGESWSESEAAPGGEPADAAGEAETIDIVRACLSDESPAGLSEQERIVLRAIAAGETDRGLARRLGISCSTVNVRKHAGYAKIRAHLSALGVDGEPGAGRAEGDRAAGSPPPAKRGGGGGGSCGGGGIGEALAADIAGRTP